MKNFYETASKRLIFYGIVHSINFVLITGIIILYCNHINVFGIFAMIVSLSFAILDFIKVLKYKKLAKAEEVSD